MEATMRNGRIVDPGSSKLNEEEGTRLLWVRIIQLGRMNGTDYACVRQ